MGEKSGEMGGEKDERSVEVEKKSMGGVRNHGGGSEGGGGGIGNTLFYLANSISICCSN